MQETLLYLPEICKDMTQPAYYLIAVSNKKNVELCMKYGLAGFTNSINGFWTYSEIRTGDYISFLYGAKAFNLYKVKKKEALSDAEKLPPWDVITFRSSGKSYYFPFRLQLELVREFTEPIVRYEFAYVAENLLLRGGYRKTHFQTDQTTLQNVSKMGTKTDKSPEPLKLPSHETFSPKIGLNSKSGKIPEQYKFNEILLQAAIKTKLANKADLKDFLKMISLNDIDAEKLEVLSEKALPQGHVDILIKNAVPIGYSKQIVVEVKRKKATEKDVVQLSNYIEELGSECEAGALVASEFPQKLMKKYKDSKIKFIEYKIDSIGKEPVSFEEIANHLVFSTRGDKNEKVCRN